MVKFRNFAIIALIGSMIFFSCKDPNQFSVDSTFLPYLNRFDSLAAIRGKFFNERTNGLIIEFANLTDNNAGLTHYEKPIRIQIDRTYWNEISNYPGADVMKEDLIFHELGHGLLNRNHLNDVLENDDWKSLMCGGTQVNNRPWNINYRGIRREYYINELFDENTPAPDFSSMTLTADTTGFSSKLFLSFDNAANAGWSITDDSVHQISIDNGRLKFVSKVSDIYLVFAKTVLDVQTDFTYELSMEYSIGNATNQYGILFGYVPANSNGAYDPVEYFTINNSQKMHMGNRSWYTYYTELTEKSIQTSGKNTLKVVKLGRMLYYFINNVYCYESEMETTQSGYNYGFMVPPNGTVWLDNFKISQKGVAGVKTVKPASVGIKFEMVHTPMRTVEQKNR